MQDSVGGCSCLPLNIGIDDADEGGLMKLTEPASGRGLDGEMSQRGRSDRDSSGVLAADAGLPLNVVGVAGVGGRAQGLVSRQDALNARISAHNQAKSEFNAQAEHLTDQQERLETHTARYTDEEHRLQQRGAELDAQVFELARELGGKLKSCSEDSDRVDVIAEVISALGLDGPQAAQAARIAAAAAFGATSTITTRADGSAVISPGKLVVSPNGIVTACDKTARPFS